ncbi:MAG: hypothetical protein QXG38_02975, partial [Candidatus Hadarchaeales archaeon]
LMAEHGVDEAVGIVADGAGYGPDGTVWGGEILVARDGEFSRKGGLMSRPMPGGDLATIFPGRMVAGLLWKILGNEEIEKIIERTPGGFPRGKLEIETVLRQLETGINVFMTSSCGRVLDAISFILGVCSERTYEGEPAMKLEALGRKGNPKTAGIHPKFKTLNGTEVLDTPQLILDVLAAVKSGVSKADVAAGAQWALADGLAQIAASVAEKEGMKIVGVSGGVFYNDLMTIAARERITSAGLKFLMHREVPPGDGGISLGQVYVAVKRIKN